MLTCMDFERDVTPSIEISPIVFSQYTDNHIQKSNGHSPWIELLHFNSEHNLSKLCEGKGSTLEITVEEILSVLGFWMLCELLKPNPEHSF